MGTTRTRWNTRDIVLAIIATAFAATAIILAIIGIPIVLDL